MSAVGRALSKALDKPEDWEFPSENRISHKPSKQDFWVGNGPFFFNVLGDVPGCIGLVERHWLYRKAIRIGAAVVIAKLAAA